MSATTPEHARPHFGGQRYEPRDLAGEAERHAAAPELPGILPVPKERGRIAGFIYRHPTISIGGLLVGLMILIAIFAPYLGTKDPTALAPARRTREPSALYWFGTDMLGRDVYSRVLYGSRVSLMVGFSVAFWPRSWARSSGLLRASFVRSTRSSCG